MELYINLLHVIKFKTLYDNNKYLKQYLTPDPFSTSLWFLEEGINKRELEYILVKNKIKYKLQ